MSLVLEVAKCPSSSLATKNKVYVNEKEAKVLQRQTSISRTPIDAYLLIDEVVYEYEVHPKVKPGTVGLTGIMRLSHRVGISDAVKVAGYQPASDDIYLQELALTVGALGKGEPPVVEAADIEAAFRQACTFQFFCQHQQIVLSVGGVTLKCIVDGLRVGSLAGLVGKQTTPVMDQKRGVLHDSTQVMMESSEQAPVRIRGSGGRQQQLFRPDWDFSKMGIGGLDDEFTNIFRRAFASRIFPPEVISRLGIKHVKGLLLFGPPGTGKTLMARQIGKMLNGREPKIVNGPEVLNKYVGQSEENIRNLFKDAEEEYAKMGDDSGLHIIIFDEMDALTPQRGSRGGGTGVADTVVNQLLSKIDGANALNNILVIGMTNRKDMIDEALLRPGRLEVHMEIGLPDTHGRLQILNIHTQKMRDSGCLDELVSLEGLAGRTKNFTGAEIEGLVKSAASFALHRNVDPADMGRAIDTDAIKVERGDFEQALGECKPALGVSEDDLRGLAPNGVIPFGDGFRVVQDTLQLFFKQVAESERTPLVTVLLEGAVGAGKTALASTMALASGFPFVRLISAAQMIGYPESGKCQKVRRVFEDSYKSPLSVILLDDIERILDYVPIGPRFSNAVLQTILILLKRQPPEGHKLLVIGTTSDRMTLSDMGFLDAFNGVLTMPTIDTADEAAAVLSAIEAFPPETINHICERYFSHTPVKKLIMAAEMAKVAEAEDVVDRFFSSIASKY